MPAIETIPMPCMLNVHGEYAKSCLSVVCSSDACVLESYRQSGATDDSITVKSFVPFDPTTKRTEVTYQDKSNSTTHRVSKGMPEAILHLCPTTEHAEKVRADVNEFARRGLRALAVAMTDNADKFVLIGLLPIFDPPREDTAETIKRALELGVRMKMITGDQLEIAQETARRLGMGDSMYIYENLIHQDENSPKDDNEINQIILGADGFAGVFPEHKFEIVKRLQDMGHLVAMTGENFCVVLRSSVIFFFQVTESTMHRHCPKPTWVLLLPMPAILLDQRLLLFSLNLAFR